MDKTLLGRDLFALLKQSGWTLPEKVKGGSLHFTGAHDIVILELTVIASVTPGEDGEFPLLTKRYKLVEVIDG